MRIEERMLRLPALYLIDKQPGINTTALIRGLEGIFHPSGEDAQILAGRNDTKFSQKVRNLISHRDHNGMNEYVDFSRGMTLTDAGRAYLEQNYAAVQYLAENPFEYEDVQALLVENERADARKRPILVYHEDGLVSEGRKTTMSVDVRKRSRQLRSAAVERYTDEYGHIRCAVCGFDFEAFYGHRGAGYIEIHHEKPIYEYPEEGFNEFIEAALERMKPLCANCHRMIHHGAGEIVTVEELCDELNNLHS